MAFRKWAAKNVEYTRAYNAAYRKRRRKSPEHMEAERAYMRAWQAKLRAANREKLRAYDRERQQRRDKSKLRIQARAAHSRRMESPEYRRRHALRGQIRRARLAGVYADGSVDRMARAIFVAYGDACAYCGGPATTIDHVIPIAFRGPHAAFNIVPACKPCNSAKRDSSRFPRAPRLIYDISRTAA